MKERFILVMFKVVDCLTTYIGINKYGYSLQAEANPVARFLIGNLGMVGYSLLTIGFLLIASKYIVKSRTVFYSLMVIFSVVIGFNTFIILFI